MSNSQVRPWVRKEFEKGKDEAVEVGGDALLGGGV